MGCSSNFQYNCGCSGGTGLNQAKNLQAYVGFSYNCFDLTNAAAWINSNWASFAPWAVQVDGYLFYEIVNFDSITSTSPDGSPFIGSQLFAPDSRGFGWASFWEIGTGSSEGYILRGAGIMPGNQAVVQGGWCDISNSGVTQNCLMNGVSTTVDSTFLGYLYDLPIPPGGLCTSTDGTPNSCGGTVASASYGIIPLSNYSDLYLAPWSGPLPSPCLSPDPFFGASPP